MAREVHDAGVVHRSAHRMSRRCAARERGASECGTHRVNFVRDEWRCIICNTNDRAR
jgi:hypothetical protein